MHSLHRTHLNEAVQPGDANVCPVLANVVANVADDVRLCDGAVNVGHYHLGSWGPQVDLTGNGGPALGNNTHTYSTYITTLSHGAGEQYTYSTHITTLSHGAGGQYTHSTHITQ